MQTQTSISDRVKLPMHYDADKLLNEINTLNLGQYVYYDAVPMRAPAHQVDPTLPPPPPATDYADGSWTQWLDTKLLKACPYLKSITDDLRQHTTVNLVRILRLAPGQTVQQHTDPTLGLHIEKSMIRLTIPVLNSEGNAFYLNGTHVEMKPGECWYLRLTDPHSVVNDSTEDRINITIDVIPNSWMRKLVEEADQEML